MYTGEYGAQYSDDKKTLIRAASKLEGEHVIQDVQGRVHRT